MAKKGAETLNDASHSNSSVFSSRRRDDARKVTDSSKGTTTWSIKVGVATLVENVQMQPADVKTANHTDRHERPLR